MYIPRAIEPHLLEALKQFPACLVTGPRQSGKSTLLQHLLKGHAYVSLDDPLHRAMAKEDPELFLSSFPAPLIIDEIQYAPELFSHLKLRIDQKRHVPGQYVLTGSQIFSLMKGVSESLAGRIAIFQLYPLHWREIQPEGLISDADCAAQTVCGFYPEFLSVPNLNGNLWHGSYLSTYVERDVRNVKAIADLGRFQTFISLLAARAGQLLNLAEIAGQCGISQPTAKDWLSILEATYVIYLLRPYHANLSKRLVKSPKVFFVDTGLLCYLLGIDTPERFFKAAERGHLFENMVVMEAVKRLAASLERASFYFYRTALGMEVDLLVERRGGIEAYEIKHAKTIQREMGQSLKRFKEEHPVKKAALLSLREEKIPLFEGVVGEHWSSFT